LNPVSVLAGVLAVAFSGYLAAVYLAADARRLAERALVHDFRIRALVSGVVAGALALAGLLVIRGSAWPLWHGLTSRLGLARVIVGGISDAGVVAADGGAGAGRGRAPRRSRDPLAAAFAVVTLAAGAGLLVFADPAWAHAIGAAALIACAVTVFGLASRPAGELPAAGRGARRAAGRTSGARCW